MQAWLSQQCFGSTNLSSRVQWLTRWAPSWQLLFTMVRPTVFWLLPRYLTHLCGWSSGSTNNKSSKVYYGNHLAASMTHCIVLWSKLIENACPTNLKEQSVNITKALIILDKSINLVQPFYSNLGFRIWMCSYWLVCWCSNMEGFWWRIFWFEYLLVWQLLSPITCHQCGWRAQLMLAWCWKPFDKSFVCLFGH